MLGAYHCTPVERSLFLYSHNKSNTTSRRCKWTRINRSFSVEFSWAPKRIHQAIHFISDCNLLGFTRCVWAPFLRFSQHFTYTIMTCESRMSLFPLANALKQELIISKAIRRVTSRYIHIPTPILGSFLPFLAPALLTFSLPFFFPLMSSLLLFCIPSHQNQ